MFFVILQLSLRIISGVRGSNFLQQLHIIFLYLSSSLIFFCSIEGMSHNNRRFKKRIIKVFPIVWFTNLQLFPLLDFIKILPKFVVNFGRLFEVNDMSMLISFFLAIKVILPLLTFHFILYKRRNRLDCGFMLQELSLLGDCICESKSFKSGASH